MSKKKIIALVIFSSVVLYLAFAKLWLFASIAFVCFLLVWYRRKLKRYFFIAIYLVRLLIVTSFRKKVETAASDDLLTFTLPNGREITYGEYGDPEGTPVFYFHGTPSCSIEAELLHTAFKEQNIRIIAPNRPGINGSDFLPGRGFSQWALDMALLADHLQIQLFSVLGFSGGGPYVAACATKIPHRLRHALIIGGAWKMNVKEAQEHIYESVRLFWKTADKSPFILPYIIKGMQTNKTTVTDEEKEAYKNRHTEVDFLYLKEGDRIECITRAQKYAVANVQGIAHDVRMYVQEWDFDPAEITFPISILHGLKDRNVPIALVKKFAASIKNAKLTSYENEGHYSVLGNQMSDVIVGFTGKLPEETIDNNTEAETTGIVNLNIEAGATINTLLC